MARTNAALMFRIATAKVIDTVSPLFSLKRWQSTYPTGKPITARITAAIAIKTYDKEASSIIRPDTCDTFIRITKRRIILERGFVAGPIYSLICFLKKWLKIGL